MKKDRDLSNLCRYNEGVECPRHDKCERCGFSPAVHAERVERVKAELDEKAKKKARRKARGK